MTVPVKSVERPGKKMSNEESRESLSLILKDIAVQLNVAFECRHIQQNTLIHVIIFAATMCSQHLNFLSSECHLRTGYHLLCRRRGEEVQQCHQHLQPGGQEELPHGTGPNSGLEHAFGLPHRPRAHVRDGM